MTAGKPGSWTFHGGLHLADHKAESLSEPLAKITLPKRLVVPLQQHIGAAAEPLVSAGDKVLKGQTIARATQYIGAPIHAPASGTVADISEQPVPHPSGLSAPCIIIQTDTEQQWAELPEPLPHFEKLDPGLLRERVRWAGIVGLGGAAFPTSVKVNHGPDNPIDTLVINGAECEPYITCDDMLMRTQADRVIEGIKILLHMVTTRECLIGVEDNKPEAIAALTQAIEDASLPRTRVISLPSKYPTGGEKQLIQCLTGKQVPSHGIPAEIGVICLNVATTAAITDAVLAGRPLLQRIVTVTGKGVNRPRNLEVPFGTPIAHVIQQAGGYSKQINRLILGGPMMGFMLHDDQVPVIKGANCLLAASADEAPEPGPAMPCIRCGKCADVCPASLLPQQLYWYSRAKDLDKTHEYNLFDCIECGCCAYVCPSHIPLVQYYRYAKTASWAAEQEKQQSDNARRRHEARVARLERIKQERQANLRKKKAALEKKPAADKDAKQAAIEAAMKRVAAKKQKATAEKQSREDA